MALERKPNTPYDLDRPNEPPHSYIDRGSPADLDQDLQPDPELAEGPASSTRVALMAIAIALVLAAVFYGLNSSSVQQASTVPAPANSQNAASTALPTAPPGMRDVTPRSNSQPGTTTGAAPAGPQAPSPAPASK